MKLYQKGILLLEHAISMKLDGEGADYDRGRTLQEKMKTNLSDAQERVEELSTLLESITPPEKTDKILQDVEDTNTSEINEKVGKTHHNKDKKYFNNERKNSPSSARKPYQDISNNKTVKLPKTLPIVKPNNQNFKVPKTVSTIKPDVSSEKKAYPSKPKVHKNGKSTAPIDSSTSDQKAKVSKLKNIDSKHAHIILNEVVEKGCGISFDDVGGMERAKQILHEIVILPSMRPELFVGLRAPVRGLLLFGPPGNGKTMLASAVATESKSVFFNISAAVLTSKFIGEGEKMVRALFAVARELQPSVIFIDEVDSLLSERKENEHEASRRMKTEFLLAFEGLVSEPNERILLMGATNRPWEIDDAALRRFTKRVYVPMPDQETRKEILKHYVSKQPNAVMSEKDFDTIARLSEGYSGSDLRNLAQDAALAPIRELTPTQLKNIPADKLRSLSVGDFKTSLEIIRPSVSTVQLSKFSQWDDEFGSR